MVNEVAPGVYSGDDIFIKVDGKVFLHATSHSLKCEVKVDAIRTKTTRRELKKLSDITWSIDGDGLVVVKTDQIDVIDTFDALDAFLAKKEVEVEIVSQLNGIGEPKRYGGKAYFKSFSKSASSGENATYSYTLEDNSDLKPVTTPNPEG